MNEQPLFPSNPEEFAEYCEFVQNGGNAVFPEDDDEHDPFMSDAEADADALASCGWGTDEDYGYYGGDDY